MHPALSVLYLFGILVLAVVVFLIVFYFTNDYPAKKEMEKSVYYKRAKLSDSDWVKTHPQKAKEFQEEIDIEDAIYEKERAIYLWQQKVDNLIKEKWREDFEKNWTEPFISSDNPQEAYCNVSKSDQYLIVVENRYPQSSKITSVAHGVQEYDRIKEMDTFSLYKVRKIPLIDIVYFRKQGDIQYTTEISGGEGHGGGVNMGGAVAGGMLFGAAGAIVGAQIGTETVVNPIESKTIKHDTRETIFLYKDKNKDIITIQWPIFYFDLLMKVIPEKEYDYLQIHKKNERNEEQSNTSNNLVDTMKQYKELLISGVITQEEFEAKKKQLLGL